MTPNQYRADQHTPFEPSRPQLLRMYRDLLRIRLFEKEVVELF